jgi:hypothetical protein
VQCKAFTAAPTIAVSRWNAEHKAENVAKACQQTLKNLQLEYLNEYLMHWPVTGNTGPEVDPPIQACGQSSALVAMEFWWSQLAPFFWLAAWTVECFPCANTELPEPILELCLPIRRFHCVYLQDSLRPAHVAPDPLYQVNFTSGHGSFQIVTAEGHMCTAAWAASLAMTCDCIHR